MTSASPAKVGANILARADPIVHAVHGDEPAGVEAALHWLEGGQWRRWRVNWLVLPCLHPHGWTHDQRRNAWRRDINQ